MLLARAQRAERAAAEHAEAVQRSKQAERALALLLSRIEPSNFRSEPVRQLLVNVRDTVRGLNGRVVALERENESLREMLAQARAGRPDGADAPVDEHGCTAGASAQGGDAGPHGDIDSTGGVLQEEEHVQEGAAPEESASKGSDSDRDSGSSSAGGNSSDVERGDSAR